MNNPIQTKPPQNAWFFRGLPQKIALDPRCNRKSKLSENYLQISSVPVVERINPKETRYVLVIQPQNVRACGGQYTTVEVQEIAKATRGWDWQLDQDNHPCCLPRLEALLDAIYRQAAGKGGTK